MIIAAFKKNDDFVRTSGLWQWDYGQMLRIQGLDLPTAVEIHFSLQRTGGESITRVGVTKDGVTDVPIPDSMLENEGAMRDYDVYAFIYLTDDTSGETVKCVAIRTDVRPKPEAFDTPEEAELFREAISAVNAAADRAEEAAKKEVTDGRINDAVDDYLNEHGIKESDPTVPEWAKQPAPDKSLEMEGQAADAKAVGDELKKLEHVIVNKMTFSEVVELYEKGATLFYRYKISNEIFVGFDGSSYIIYGDAFLLPLTYIDYTTSENTYPIRGFVFSAIVSDQLCYTAKIYDEGKWVISNYKVCLEDSPKLTGSISMGRLNKSAVGKESVALGRKVSAESDCSVAFGWGSCSKGGVSFTCGQNCSTDINAYAAYAEGDGTYATSYAQHVQGKFNLKDTEGKYAHIVGNGTGINNRSNAHTVDWEGNAWYQGSVTSNGADYAEFFEWIDGNPDNEDRVGLLVSLNGEKIHLANTGDEILGIISGTAAVLGDNYECEWNGKYLTDDFGRILYDMVEEFIDITTGIDEETGEPITETKSLGFFKHPRLNPDYDPEQAYINREDRPEWATVGMIGKLYLRDDGTCVVNGYAAAGGNGIATASTEKTHMRVLSRVNENIVRVLVK